MALITAITTCKGRLEHLKQTLPALMRVAELEVVVVDYDCPDGAAEWVRANHPRARVVEVVDRPLFNRSIARNLGAAAASSDWFFFVDADVRVAETFVQTVSGLLQPNRYLLADPRPPELWGAVVLARADFETVGGYDEAFEGWGVEDVDILERLTIARVREASFPSGMLESIPHDDATRSRFHEMADIRLNASINGFYRIAKNDLLRQNLPLDLEGRLKLYADIRRAFDAPGGIQSFQIAFRDTFVHNFNIITTLRYDFTPRTPK